MSIPNKPVDDCEKEKFRSTPDGVSVSVTNQETNYKTIIDTSTTAGSIYIGESELGSSTASNVWRITKITTSSGIITITMTGDLFNSVWNDRAGLTYV
jgi:hypothetical protein